MQLLYNTQIDNIIRLALEEDIGSGDITTLSTIPADRTAKGRFLAKEDGVLCGMDVCRAVFEYVDPTVVFTANVSDGTPIRKGEVLAEISGNARSILTGERLSLNLLQHMSGIATRTAEAVAKVAGTGARIADTRKTTPGLRVLEKYAVRCGGGSNHRFNLADGVLIKDNHIRAAGSIKLCKLTSNNPVTYSSTGNSCTSAPASPRRPRSDDRPAGRRCA